MPCAQVGQLVYVLRKRISLPAEKAIFLFVDNTCEHYCMHTTCACACVHTCACVRCVSIACASHTHARRTHMRVAHTCRLPPSGALLSSIYLKCHSVVKMCTRAVQMHAACLDSAHEVLTGR